jgi:hypothetical protein
MRPAQIDHDQVYPIPRRQPATVANAEGTMAMACGPGKHLFRSGLTASSKRWQPTRHTHLRGCALERAPFPRLGEEFRSSRGH